MEAYTRWVESAPWIYQHLDASAVGFDQLINQREAKPSAALLTRETGVQLHERRREHDERYGKRRRAFDP